MHLSPVAGEERNKLFIFNKNSSVDTGLKVGRPGCWAHGRAFALMTEKDRSS